MFIGRESELGKLNKMYSGNKFECAIIYGRRRVGKTSRIQEFIKYEAGGRQSVTKLWIHDIKCRESD